MKPRIDDDPCKDVPAGILRIVDEYIEARVLKAQLEEKVKKLQKELDQLLAAHPAPAPKQRDGCTCDLLHTSTGCPEHDWRK
jgi:hypothetical protein